MSPVKRGWGGGLRGNGPEEAKCPSRFTGLSCAYSPTGHSRCDLQANAVERVPRKVKKRKRSSPRACPQALPL